MNHRIESLTPWNLEDEHRKSLNVRASTLKAQLSIHRQAEMLAANPAFKVIQEEVGKVLDANMALLMVATDEAQMRQSQGAAQTCGAILNAMKIDTHSVSRIEQELKDAEDQLAQLQMRKETKL